MLSGRYELGFEPLARAFADVLSRAPYGGAALTLYLDGQPVFDMWGGPRDSEGRPWEERTCSVSFSTAKGVAATALHLCRDRGLVDYDAPVAQYWPEFAQNGKQNITLRHLLNHSAGLYNAFQLIEQADDLYDWEKTVAALARAAPAHEPGRFHAYHALTFGHLVGEVVQRVTRRPFSQFVQDEIAAPLGLSQFYIGAPDSALPWAATTYRKARSEPPSPRDDESRSRSAARSQRMR
ncbi:MAG TPA: serine hydrolase domain-containing protein, partial [Polyangiales bacterium]